MTDRCTNANRGTFNHECGRPAVWLGTQPSGHRQAFCAECKANGDEAASVVAWTTPIFHTEPTPIGNQYVIPGCEKDKSRGPKQPDLF